MPPENMWGDIPNTPARTPYLILKEQAEKLTELTRYTLHGEASQRDWSGRFNVDFSIRVPTLEDYRFQILQVQYGIGLYPLEIRDAVHNTRTSCSSEEEFLAATKKILTSPEVKNAISVLLAQASG